MKLLIQDLDGDTFASCFPQIERDIEVISDNGQIRNCIGCFGCWIKTPGECVIKDGYDCGARLGRCDELIIISECTYGGFSPFVKNVLDRSISYIHPYFVLRGGEMHHKRRYDNIIAINVYFYGKHITDGEKETARQIVAANAVNYDGVVGNIVFLCGANELKGMSL